LEKIQPVHAFKTISEHLQIAVQNVFLIRNVQVNTRAFNRNAVTHAQAHVELTLIVESKIMFLYALALKDMKEIHFHLVVLQQLKHL
jgi:hypothetical protein